MYYEEETIFASQVACPGGFLYTITINDTF